MAKFSDLSAVSSVLLIKQFLPQIPTEKDAYACGLTINGSKNLGKSAKQIRVYLRIFIIPVDHCKKYVHARRLIIDEMRNQRKSAGNLNLD